MVIASGILAGCDIINPSDPVPAYVWVDEFEFTTTPEQGSSSHKITEGWFYADGEFLGAYDLPGAIPVIGEGATEILLFPGINVNGITTTPDIYPLYDRYTTEASLVIADTVFVNPTTKYVDNIFFSFREDFESGNSFTDDIDGNPETFMRVTDKEVFEGERSGYIRLDADSFFIQVANLPIIESIPLNGAPVFLEMDYKNNIEFAVGLLGRIPNLPPFEQVLIVLRPQNDWNKIYIDLTQAINVSELPGYQVFFGAVHDPNFDFGNSEVFLDNIKVVHFQE